jgi:azobenzene reductase
MNVVILSGGNRRGSTSTLLSRYIAKVLQARGIHTELFDLYESPLPMYSKDVDHTSDANVAAMKQLFGRADGIVLSTPEYHASISGILKNALDHLGSADFNDKPVLSVSSAGGAVGVSSLQHLQVIVRNLHGINCPEWISIGGDQRQFDEHGEPVHEAVRKRVDKVTSYFAGLVGKFSA